MARATDQVVQHLVTDDHFIREKRLGHVDVVVVSPPRDAHPARAGELLAGHPIELQTLEVAGEAGAPLGSAEPGPVLSRRIETLVHRRSDRISAAAQHAGAQQKQNDSSRHAARCAVPVGPTMIEITPTCCITRIGALQTMRTLGFAVGRRHTR